MVGMRLVERLRGFFGYISTSRMLEQINQMEKEKTVLDNRYAKLAKATMDGDERWFLSVARKNPDCAMKIIEECRKDDA
jgi:hypothetical protein